MATRDDFYERQHQKNLPTFKELGARIMQGLLKIIDIRIERPEIGHATIVILFHEVEE